MPDWPVSLPQSLPLNVQETSVDGRIRSEMDAGQPKVRRRYTAEVKHYQIDGSRFVLDEAQRDDLEDFYITTLKLGTLQFTWDEPWSGAGARTFRFVERPQYTVITAGPSRKFSTAFSLEELP